jgi:hypothetical protein
MFLSLSHGLSSKARGNLKPKPGQNAANPGNLGKFGTKLFERSQKANAPN